MHAHNSFIRSDYGDSALQRLAGNDYDVAVLDRDLPLVTFRTLAICEV